MSVFANRHEIHKILDSLPPEALPDLMDYLDYLRFRASREAVGTRVEEAIRLYAAGEISLGRAAELADMNYFKFEELLRQRGVQAVKPNTSRAQVARQRELIDDILS